MIDGADLARHSIGAILDGVADGVTIQDATGQLVFVNDAAARICGFPDAATMLATPFEEVRAAFTIFAADGSPLSADDLPSRKALRGESPPDMLLRYRRADSSEERWSVLKSRAVVEPDGTPQLVVNILRDVTQRVMHERAMVEHASHLAALNARLSASVDALEQRSTELEHARAALEDAERRARFLAEAGELLAASLEYENTLNAVAALAVPIFADVVSVDLLDGDGRVRRVAARAIDAAVERASFDVIRDHPIELSDGSAAARIFATGEPLFYPEFDGAARAAWARSAAHLGTMEGVGLRSAIIAPLAGKAGVFGIVCFGCTTDGRRFGARDFEFACELARRMAAAIANASLYRDAQLARSAAEQASRAKSQFLAVMSHELRTPLNGVLGYADLLAAGIGGTLNDAQMEYVHRIGRSGRQLLGLVDDVLSHVRVEAAQEVVQLATVDARAVARDAAAVVEAQVALRELSLLIEMPDSPVEIRTDAGKLRQILLNLLSNALKFTPSGTIGLRITCAAETVCYQVTDTGIGIAPEHIDLIFEPFTQVDQTNTRAAGGVGLGLAVSRQMATLLGGTLVCRSELARGTTFTLTLPLNSPEPAAY